MVNKMKVAVIGGGASGMTAAVTAMESGADVTLFEKKDRVGKKLLSTGNGKCNLSNLEFNMSKFYCSDKDKLHNIFRVFSVWDTLSFFESSGMMLRNKEGYLYPYSEQASTVLDTFRMRLKKEKVTVLTDTGIEEARVDEKTGQFSIKDAAGREYLFDKLIIACGGPASQKKGEGMDGYKLAESFGHSIKKLAPGLTQLKSDDSFIKALAGVRCQAKATLIINGQAEAEETGELQFTDYGISGIPVFQFSRVAAYALEQKKKVEVKVDFFPDKEDKTFLYESKLRYETQKDKVLEDFLTGTVNKKINMAVIKTQGFKPQDKTEEAGWKKIEDLLKAYRNFIIHIKDVNSMENAQICAGGVDFSEISTELESSKVKGLYFAGEVVDVDAKCGGYNLQWAWSSGYVAGKNAAGIFTGDLIPVIPEKE